MKEEKEDLSLILSEMREFITDKIAAGYYPPDQIVDATLSIFSDEAAEFAILSTSAHLYVTEEIAFHLQQEAHWSKETDCDRLDSAFHSLEQNGIIARQNFSCCRTCGLAEIDDEIEKARKSNPAVRGYTFFHLQDTEAAVEGRGVMLFFGHCDDTKEEEESLAIGKEIVNTLAQHGLSPVWDGSFSKRILIPMNWQRRYKFASGAK